MEVLGLLGTSYVRLSLCHMRSHIRGHNNVFYSWLVTCFWTLRRYKTKQWHWLNFQRVIWDLPVEVNMSHIANSDKGAARVLGSRLPEVKNPMSCLASKKNYWKKKRQSTLCFTHQELLVISDEAAEGTKTVASKLLFTQGEQKATKSLLPPEHEGMRNGEFLKREERNTLLW